MEMIGWARRIIAVASVLAAASAHGEVEIIALRYRSVEQVIPIIRPLVESGGAVSGMNNQLVIRASRANIPELRRVLDAIDIAQRRLMIQVRQDSAAAAEARGATIGIAIASDRAGAAGSVQGRVIDARAGGEDRLLQRLQVTEGVPAMIQVGQSLPVTERTIGRTPGGAVIASESVRYRDVTSGFEVTARVNADRVTLELRPRRESAGADGAVNLQRLESTASGRLGEWFELGGVSQQGQASASGWVAGTTALRQDNRRIWVKVEEIR